MDRYTHEVRTVLAKDILVARRSQISQYSANRASAYSNMTTDAQSPSLPCKQTGANHSQYSLTHSGGPGTPRLEDTDRIEDLSHSDSAPSVADYFKPLPSPSPATGPAPSPASSTVAYGPDQMLAVYAARAANAKAPLASPALPAPSPSTSLPSSTSAGNNAGSMGKKGGIKILTSFGRKDSEDSSGPHPALSPKDISAPMPIPVPSPSLRVPPVVMTRQRSGTVGRGGQPGHPGNTQGQGDDVGHAQ